MRLGLELAILMRSRLGAGGTGLTMKRGITFGAVATSSALLAVAAFAVAALQPRSAEEEVAAGGEGSPTAKCDNGSAAVSGGLENPDYGAGSASALYIGGLLRDGDRRVTAAGGNSGTSPATLIAHAYCDKSNPDLQTVTKSAPVEDDFKAVSAKCAPGSEAVWGGFSSDGNDSILSLGSSRDTKRKWTASAIQFGDPSTLTVYAYCDKSEPGLMEKSKSVMLGHDELGSATAKCRKGHEAVSGGYLQPGEFGTSAGSEIYFFESYRVSKRRWTASGLNQGDPGSRLTAFAYCTA